MYTVVAPQVRELDSRDITAMLSRLHVGRIAFLRHDRIEIRPIHYVYSQGQIFGRTAPGRLFHATHDHGTDDRIPVVFEVDEVESLFRWKSIIVRGSLQLLSREANGAAEWTRATNVLRTLVRGALTDQDPTPERSCLFRIHVDEITGRSMS
jgi:uncharacterized protein